MATEPSTPAQGPPPPPGPGHRVHDPSAKWLFIIVGGLFLVGLCLQFILAGMLHLLKHQPPSSDAWHPRRLAAAPAPPGPRLQLSPAADLKGFRAREEAELNSYGWLNRTTGVVRLPIERAMELVLQQKLPVRSGTNPLGPSTYQLIQKRPEQREREIQGQP